jgi:hypothetical protein
VYLSSACPQSIYISDITTKKPLNTQSDNMHQPRAWLVLRENVLQTRKKTERETEGQSNTQRKTERDRGERRVRAQR